MFFQYFVFTFLLYPRIRINDEHLPSHAEDGLDEALGAVRDGVVAVLLAKDSNAGPDDH